MLTIIQPGLRKILTLLYQNQSAQFHVREIARRTNLNQNSTVRFLQQLEKNKIINAQKIANLKQYKFRPSRITWSILTMLDCEKLERLPLLRKNGIATYLNALPIPPVFAIVFGSTAKETYKEESDIDILLVTSKKINTKAAEQEAQALNSTKMSTFQISDKNFMKELKHKEDPVIQSAINTGYPLLNHIFYYEVIHNERI